MNKLIEKVGKALPYRRRPTNKYGRTNRDRESTFGNHYGGD